MMCNCESVRHFSLEESPDYPDIPRDGHAYLKAEAGSAVVAYLGAICDECSQHPNCPTGTKPETASKPVEDWADHKAAEVVTHFGTRVDSRPIIAAALRDAYTRGYGVAASAVAS